MIQNFKRKIASFKISMHVGSFLAVRDIKNSNKWTTILIVFVMTLTFLNLVVVSGILVGLIEGSSVANKKYYAGDIIISPYPNEGYIRESQDIIKKVEKLPGFKGYTARYGTGGRITSNYRETLNPNQVTNTTASFIVGINPDRENSLTTISDKLIEGSFITSSDVDSVVLGSDLLFKYSPIDSPSQQTLKNVGIGSKILIEMNGNKKEFIIKGILKTKVNDVDLRVFMNETIFRKLSGRSDLNVYEIVAIFNPGTDISITKSFLIDQGVDQRAVIKTFEEAEPKFLQDIKDTFGMLGNIIGSIGLVVASITIFIVIFVNAITRRRYIGILKGIGISVTAIQISYIIQALFYAFLGVFFGSILVFFILKPFLLANPINFPFSDGILVATIGGTLTRSLILFMATIFAGYIPSLIVVRQNTLDAILGR